MTLLATLPPMAMAGPLSDITARNAPPPPDQDEVDAARKADEEKAAADSPTKLDSVVVTGRRTRQESEAEKVRKALEQKKPKPGPDPDLNKASDKTQEQAAWSQDADAYKNLPGDPTHQFNAPVGDETGGCGADITKGCKPHR